MNDRHTVDSLTSDALDALYERLEAAEDTESQRQLAAAREALASATIRATRAEVERDGAYRERAHLVALLAALHPSHIGYTDPAAIDWLVVTIETPTGQMSWHIAERDRDLFEHVRLVPAVHNVWDGHTTEEKYARLRRLTTDPGRADATAARVRALHRRNENTGECEYCSFRDYPTYTVPYPCDTVRALDGEQP
jgi:hypothetical protein